MTASRDDAVSADEAKAEARRELSQVKRQIQLKTRELLTAGEADVQALTKDLQRLRVSAMMLHEIVEDVFDPNTYRELNLLNKMLTGLDPEAEALKREQAKGDEEAKARMEAAGIVSPEQAHGLVRVLQALRSVMETPDDGNDRRPPALQ